MVHHDEGPPRRLRFRDARVGRWLRRADWNVDVVERLGRAYRLYDKLCGRLPASLRDGITATLRPSSPTPADPR